jgi:hypothetical protein
MGDFIDDGGEDLVLEEQALRAELQLWCRKKLASGARPVPLQFALQAVADEMEDPDGNGLVSVS